MNPRDFKRGDWVACFAPAGTVLKPDRPYRVVEVFYGPPMTLIRLAGFTHQMFGAYRFRIVEHAKPTRRRAQARTTTADARRGRRSRKALPLPAPQGATDPNPAGPSGVAHVA